MPQIAWRIIIVVLVAFFLWLVVPLLLSVLGIAMPGAMLQLIRICLAFIALWYIFWGPPITGPNI